MAEGFYRARDNEDLPESLLSSIQAVCTIFTNRQLHYRLCTTEAEADEWSGLIMGPSGEDIYRWGLTQSELDALDLSEEGSDWARGHLHELIEHLSTGGALPFQTKMKGGATATLISSKGHLLTNHHLVIGIQRFHEFPDQVVVPDGVPMPHHRIQTSDGLDLGPMRLCYVDKSIDLAILKVEPPEQIFPVSTRETRVKRHERVWHWGYPQLTRRLSEQRKFFGYSDADYYQAYSVGLVLTDPEQSEWFTDADSVLGMSGASVFDDAGYLIGLFWGGGAGGGLATILPKRQRYQYRRVVDIRMFRKQYPQFFE